MQKWAGKLLDLAEQMQLLEMFGNLGSKNAAELDAAFKFARDVYGEGRNKWMAAEQDRLAQVSQLQANVVDSQSAPALTNFQTVPLPYLRKQRLIQHPQTHVRRGPAALLHRLPRGIQVAKLNERAREATLPRVSLTPPIGHVGQRAISCPERLRRGCVPP